MYAYFFAWANTALYLVLLINYLSFPSCRFAKMRGKTITSIIILLNNDELD